MNLTYPEIFAARGDLYHAAMMAWPHARDAEFDALFARRPLAGGERVLDFPSGGGYLARHLEGKARVVGYELTDGFAAGIPVGLPSREADPEPYDRAVCLAALHHIDDQPGFLRELATRVKPGGLLHVGDVPAGSPLGAFLDGFVGRYNQTGHQGLYLSPHAADYAALGEVQHCAEVATPWRFPDEATMLGFCAQLFGLSGHDPRELLAALREQVGVDTGPDGVSLRWRLLYVDILVSGNP